MPYKDIIPVIDSCPYHKVRWFLRLDIISIVRRVRIFLNAVASATHIVIDCSHRTKVTNAATRRLQGRSNRLEGCDESWGEIQQTGQKCGRMETVALALLIACFRTFYSHVYLILQSKAWGDWWHQE